jgi:predicted nucleic acid-binding protein
MNRRTFVVFIEPSLSDPEHLIKMTELNDDHTMTNYSSTEPLRDLLDAMDYEAAKQEGRDEATKEILEILGVSSQFYIERVRQHLEQTSEQK